MSLWYAIHLSRYGARYWFCCINKFAIFVYYLIKISVNMTFFLCFWLFDLWTFSLQFVTSRCVILPKYFKHFLRNRIVVWQTFLKNHLTACKSCNDIITKMFINQIVKKIEKKSQQLNQLHSQIFKTDGFEYWSKTI